MISTRFIIDMSILLAALIPTLVLFRHYLLYRINDYLIFSMTFFMVVLDAIINRLLESNPQLVLFQLQYFFINVGIFFFFLNIVNMRGGLKKSKIGQIVLFLLLIMSLSIVFWKPITDQPDNITFLFLKIPVSPTAQFHPIGAGMTINNHIIYSTSFPVLTDIFLLVIGFSFLISYFTIVPINRSEEVTKSLKLWKIVGTGLLLYAIFRLPWFGINDQILPLFLLISLLTVLYISVRYPEGLIISYSQIFKIYDFIATVENMGKEKAVEEYDNDHLVDYLYEVGQILKEDTKTNQTIEENNG